MIPEHFCSLLKGEKMTTISMSEIRLKLSELANRVIYGGERVVVVQHSVISADPNFDGIAVRNVEVLLRDNDTPGLLIG